MNLITISLLCLVCRSCIVHYLDSSFNCPVCHTEVHKTRPLVNVRYAMICAAFMLYKICQKLEILLYLIYNFGLGVIRGEQIKKKMLSSIWYRFRNDINNIFNM